MRIEIINTGSELLLGQVTNTHVGYFGAKLAQLGLRIQRQTTIADGPQIGTLLRERLRHCDVLLITGGLGPTSDDITRDEVATTLGLSLVYHPEIHQSILDFFARRKLTPPDMVRVQAMVPENAIVLPNNHGTAPGFLIKKGKKQIYCLPGPPRELHPMVETDVLPRLAKALPAFHHTHAKILRVYGLGESMVQELVEQPLRQLSSELEIGYCARPGEVDLRLIATTEPDLAAAVARCRSILGDHIFAEDSATLQETVITLAAAQGKRIATAESCTGGLVAHLLTNVPGVSAVLDRGWVTYSNAAKVEQLGVPMQLIEQYGAVSTQVAAAMARGALDRSPADIAVALSGIAGPGGGSESKPVGLLCLATASRDPGGTIQTKSSEKHLVPHRETFKTMSAQAALDSIRRTLLSNK